MSDLGCLDPEAHGENSPRDRRIAALAASQHGVIAARQLATLGVGQGAIQYRLDIGRLHVVHRGVYAVGHTALRPRGYLMAAVLACGPGALVSHRSAADHLGIRRTGRAAIDVTTTARARAGRPGIDLHRVRHLHPDDRTVLEAIPVTSVSRTLLDLAEVLHARELERAFEEAERLRLLDVRTLEELCRRSQGRRGLRPLRALLAEVRPQPAATRSELERRFLELCDETGLPRPGVNLFVAGFEVDMVWPSQRLVVELDSNAFHRGRAAFERDRIRDGALQLAGYRVLRLTHRRLERDAIGAVQTVRSLLAAR